MTNKSLYLFGIAGMIGAVAAFFFYPKAFPQSALKVDITHREAEERAIAYLKREAIDLSPEWRRATVFTVDNDAQIFLQRALGIPQFIQAVATDLELEPWQYATRFFRPLEKEEYEVGVDARGNLISFRHTVEEAGAGASLTKEQARSLAVAFAARELQIDLANYEEKGYQDEKLDKRVDHSFDFELRGYAVAWSPDERASKGAKRINVTVQGDEIGSFSKYVFVPEDFQRLQQTADASGFLLVIVAGVLELVFSVFAVLFLFRRYKTGDLRGRWLVMLTAFAALLLVLAAASAPATLFFDYPTTTPWLNFLTTSILLLIFAAAFFVFFTLLTALPGESLAREIFPHANDVDPQKSHPQRRVFLSIIKGFLLGIFLIGYISAFYYFGARFFGIWAPVTPEVFDYMASFLPFLVPLAVGATAAVSEELSFRLFGISLVKKYLRFTPVALLIPAMIWAFLHSTYPVYPTYVRGIELTIVGLILGYVFLKEGILTTMVAHFTLNSFLLSLPLLASASRTLRTWGIIAILLTIGVPFLYYLLTRGSPQGSGAQRALKKLST